MKKRICNKVKISVYDDSSIMHETYAQINFNSMFDFMKQVRILESLFELKYKRKINGFSVEIKGE